MGDKPLSDDEFDELEALTAGASGAPWRAFVEGRDHTSGDDFIRVGEGETREEDMYVSRGMRPASAADLDFIAAARNYIPRLIAEVRRLRERR
jgi:hypothetical protein